MMNFIMKTKQRLGVLPGYSVSTCICSFSNASACWSELTPSALTFPCNKQYENYYEHTYAPDKDSLVWRLDYNKRSDFDDVAGHWHLEDHPSKPVRFLCSILYETLICCAHVFDLSNTIYESNFIET